MADHLSSKVHYVPLTAQSTTYSVTGHDSIPASSGPSVYGGSGDRELHGTTLMGSAGQRFSTMDLRSLPGRAAAYRAKKSRVMKWLFLHASGLKQVLALDKRQVSQFMGLDIPVRDMRLLDSSLANYASLGQLLVRDNALVLCMEHVRMIIAADKVIIPLDDEKGDKSDIRERFNQYLEQSIQERAGEVTSMGGMAPASAQNGSGSRPSVMVDDGQPLFQLEEATGTGGGISRPSTPTAMSQREEEMPFELHVLEAGLGEVCNHLSREVDLLQASAQPALEDLINTSDQANLERVRRVKTSHQRLLNRVTIVRDALHRIMEDDTDMWRMCLSKQQARKTMLTATPSLAPAAQAELAAAAAGLARTPSAGLPQAAAPMATAGSGDHSPEALGLDFGFPGSASLRPPGMLSVGLRRLHHKTPTNDRLSDMNVASNLDDEDDWHNLLDVENLLESYYMLADATYQSLVNIGEYIDDTEDLVNIQLDYARNKLIRFEILLTMGTFALAFWSCVAGILGENLVLPGAITQDVWGFILVNGSTCGACIIAFLAIYWTLKLRKLL